MFRRRRRDADEPDDELLDPEADADLDEPLDGPLDGPLDDAGQPVADDLAAEPGPTTGPWDVDDLPEGDDVARVDLGGLLVPVTADVELRVDMTPEGEVVSATLVSRGSAMQVNAFAAPRRQGIWAEVRQEIAASVSAGGGSTEEADGPFGVELRARVPSEVPGQGRVLQAARFLGVDGPRWFLRGLVSGPAATDPKQAAALENLFRQVVVVRGKDAMAPRDQLPMHLPREVTDAGLAEDAGGAAPDINRLERGPEIAETR